MKGINSKLIHGRPTQDPHRSLKPAVYETAAYDFATAEEVEAAFTGKTDAYMYSRIANPTVRELENRLQTLAGAEACICVSSGMAAISTALLTVCDTGDNIITSKYLFSNSYVLFTKTLPSLGINVKFVDLENADELNAAIDERTRVLFLENITNPILKVYDIEPISKVAAQRQVLLMVDNSMLSPYLFRSAHWGVDIEVTSTTKFISGGATSIGGAVFTFASDKWSKVPKLKQAVETFGKEAFSKKLSKELFRNIGVCMSPHTAYLQLLGLETLTLRVDRICENARQVAEHMSQHPAVKEVLYPALEGSPYRELSEKYFGGRPGSLVGLVLEDKKTCYAFMNALQMIRRGTNFCDNKSMIIHPASTMYADLSDEVRDEMGIDKGLLRLGVGLEDVNDIIGDIEQALIQIGKA